MVLTFADEKHFDDFCKTKPGMPIPTYHTMATKLPFTSGGNAMTRDCDVETLETRLGIPLLGFLGVFLNTITGLVHLRQRGL